MRSALIIGGGFLLWALCLAAAHFVGGLNARSAATATSSFVGLWFIAAVLNLWMGVARAGYPFREELPIFLMIFLVPVLVAFFVKWKWWGATTG
jgi:hypothetical protein